MTIIKTVVPELIIVYSFSPVRELCGVAPGCGLNDRGFGSRREVGVFSSPPRPDRLWGPPSLLSNEYERLFPWGVERSAREADHSPLSSAEDRNTWSYISTPPIRLHGVMLS